MQRRIWIQWTTTAKEGLKKLPLKVRRGLLKKADELEDCDDPRKVNKPLTGPLQGFYRIVYSRYRAIYKVEEEKLANKNIVIRIKILFVAVGQRKEHDKHDVYKLAKKLVELGLLDVEGKSVDDDE